MIDLSMVSGSHIRSLLHRLVHRFILATVLLMGPFAAANVSTLVGADQAYGQSISVPPISGQHSWAHRGSDNRRSALLAATGPESPILEPPEWPFGPVNDSLKASPVIDANGNVYFGSTDSTFFALRPSADATTRLQRWSFRATGPIRSAAAIKPTSPEFPHRRIYFTTADGHLSSLDSNGSLIWQHRLSRVSVKATSSPAITTVPGEPGPSLMRLYIATSKGIYAFEERGSSSNPNVHVLWHEPRVKSSHSVAISPDGDRVYVTAGGSFYALDADQRSGSQILAQTQLGGDLTGPVVDEADRAYVGSNGGVVYQMDASNARTLNRDAFTGPIRAGPALMPGGQLTFVSGDMLYATSRTLQQSTWRFQLSAQSPPWQIGSEVVVDGRGTVFVADGDRRAEIHAIRNGKEVWRHPISGSSSSPPALTRDGRLYMGTGAGRMHAIQSEPAFKIAFESNRRDTTLDIYSIRSVYGTTGTFHRLTRNPALDTGPAYSSLGQWLAFTSDRDQQSEDVFVGTASAKNLFNLDTSNPQNPFNIETRERDPAFSPTNRQGRSLLPDGKRYLAVTTGFRSGWEVYFVDLETLIEQHQVTGVDLQGFLQRQTTLQLSSQIPSQHAQVAFSPDGKLMAYGGCEQTGSGLEYQLRVVNMDQDTQSIVTRDSTNDCSEAPHYHPSFSPDANYLVYEKGGVLYLTGDMTRLGTALTPVNVSLVSNHTPAWSPDGTEIVIERSFFNLVLPPNFNTFPTPGPGSSTPSHRRTRALRVLFGPNYSADTLISGGYSSDGAYHPRRLPEPETQLPRCNASQTLLPMSQQPGETIEIRGCGFDIRFPKNNTVIFSRADGHGVVRVAANSTRVEPSSGLGVIEVEVPMVAGDGKVVVDTPFGASETVTTDFRVRPLATDLRRSETLPDAFVRILGYGFETSDLNSYSVQFPGGASVSPMDVRLAKCQSPDTPCRLSQVSSGEVGWLEVQVPSNVSPGTVTVERTIGGASYTDQPQQQLSLLTPQISLSRNTGSAGSPTANLDPVRFTMSGSGFPYDPYFNYTRVELTQRDPGGPDQSLGSASLTQHNTFTTRKLEVKPNTGGDLIMEARLPGARNTRPLARATAPFSTPLKNPPIIFVPGTSGTFVEYEGPSSAGPIYGRLCGTTTMASLSPIASAIAGAPAAITFASIGASAASWPHSVSDYWPGENIWLGIHGLTHILAGCPNWLDAIHLNPDSNQPPSKYSDMAVGNVMKKITLPGSDMVIYSDLFDFMRDSLNREIVEYGDSCGGSKPCTYLFNADWRLGMDSQSQRLDRLVDKALQETGAAGVALVTHSYGGPAAKYYLRTRSDASDKVDQVISLGGGFMGVVKPYKVLEIGSHWGVEFGPFKLKDQKPQQMARDWPTAYWQLPQSNWSLDASNGHNNVNRICPRLGSRRARNCGWIDAEWDATKNRFGPNNYSKGPGILGNGQKPYSFIEDATALHPFRGRPGLGPPLMKFYPNINNSTRSTKYPLGAVYQPGTSFSDKFGTAHRKLLDVTGSQNNSTLSCPPQFSGTGLGDWRCGTQGVFFHRLVGWGKPTQAQIRFTHDRRCIINIAGVPPVCYSIRNIVSEKTLEGDNVIPLRSAVGILENDAAFDSRDSRIWGIDGSGKSDYDSDGTPDGANLHSALPQLHSVHQFVEYAVGGKLTDITQLPSNAAWPSSNWPFESPCGVPSRPSSVPQNTSCSPRSLTTASKRIQEDYEYWKVELKSNAALSVRNEEGQRAGPVPELPGAESRSFPGIIYERDYGRTQVYLPVESGTYEFSIKGQDSLQEGRAPELAELRIAPEGHLAGGPAHIFHAVPIKASTNVEFTWDTDGPADEPTLRLDLNGNGEATELTPDATLTGSEVGDEQPPTTEIRVEENELRIDARDEGGSGIHRIYYGTDRAHANPKVYDGPVELPENTSYVWAFAVDRAGNTALEPAVYRSCQLPMDFDGNGAVQRNDLEAVAGHWLSHRLDRFNLNGVGAVDVGDIQRTATALEEECPSSFGAAPDPIRREETNGSLHLRTSSTVQSGDRFTVDVVLEEPEDVAGLEAVLSYPSRLLTLDDISLSDRWTETGRTIRLLGPHTGSISTSSGHAVAFGAYSVGREDGLNESAVVVHLTFMAENPGSARLQVFEAQVSDAQGTLSEPDRGTAEITIEDM